MKTLSQAQGAILRFFHLEHWQDAVERFGGSVSLERLSRFKVQSFSSIRSTFI